MVGELTQASMLTYNRRSDLNASLSLLRFEDTFGLVRDAAYTIRSASESFVIYQYYVLSAMLFSPALAPAFPGPWVIPNRRVVKQANQLHKVKSLLLGAFPRTV